MSIFSQDNQGVEVGPHFANSEHATIEAPPNYNDVCTLSKEEDVL